MLLKVDLVLSEYSIKKIQNIVAKYEKMYYIVYIRYIHFGG